MKNKKYSIIFNWPWRKGFKSAWVRALALFELENWGYLGTRVRPLISLTSLPREFFFILFPDVKKYVSDFDGKNGLRNQVWKIYCVKTTIVVKSLEIETHTRFSLWKPFFVNLSKNSLVNLSKFLKKGHQLLIIFIIIKNIKFIILTQTLSGFQTSELSWILMKIFVIFSEDS